jgi:hypothetical protein
MQVKANVSTILGFEVGFELGFERYQNSRCYAAKVSRLKNVAKASFKKGVVKAIQP